MGAVHNPYWYDGCEQPVDVTACEKQLLFVIISFFDFYKGSIPSERIQNTLKRDYATLYERVVIKRHHRRWHRFLLSHRDVLVLFTLSCNGNMTWRIRLNIEGNWEEVDRKEHVRRMEMLLIRLRNVLGQLPGHQGMLKKVVRKINTVSMVPDKIHATDLHRVCTKENGIRMFDDNGCTMIHMKDE